MAPKKSPKGAKRKTDEQAGAAESEQQEQPQAEKQADPQEEKQVEQAGATAENGDDAEAQEPEPKRQATEAAKEDLDAAAPLDAGAAPDTVVEEGRIYFVYRPKVNNDNPQSVDDLQRFFIILSPTSRKDAKHRLLAIGKKRLPSAAKHERFFGFVYNVADSVDGLMGGLGVEKYETKTRGTREKPAARIAGEGVYVIEGKEGDRQTRLAYDLELPQEPGAVQHELQIEKQANYVLSIKNPDMGDPANAGLNDKADYLKDDKKMEQFGNYRWIGAHDTTLLDYPRCEFLLIGGGAELTSNLDSMTKEHLEKAEHEEVVKALHAALKDDKAGDKEAEEEALLAKLRAELHTEKEGIPTEPSKEGNWK